MGYWTDCELFVGGDVASLGLFERGEAEKLATQARFLESVKGLDLPTEVFEQREAEAGLALPYHWSPFWDKAEASGQATTHRNVRRYEFAVRSRPAPTNWLGDVGGQFPGLRFALLWVHDWSFGQDRWHADAYVMRIVLPLDDTARLWEEIGGRRAWQSEALDWTADLVPAEIHTSPTFEACARLFPDRVVRAGKVG
jgi:hypothetical protein